MLRAKLAAATAALAVVFWPCAAHAADNGEWSVAPTPPANPGPAPRQYFFLEATPGTSVQDSVRLVNLADQPRTFRMYGADAYNTPRDGGFGLRTQDQKQTDVGAWTQVGAVTVNVPAKTQVDIPFVITVPANASPGDHVGGIVAMEEQPSATTRQSGVDVAVRRAVAARVYLRVSGPTVPGLSITAVRLRHDTPWLPSTVDGGWACVVTNTGNLHLPPTITVKVTGLFGHRVRQRTTVPQVDLLPGARTELSGAVDGVWPFDIVTTTVTAVADGGVTARASDRTIVISWPVVAVLLAGTGWLLWYRRRRRKAARTVSRRRVNEPVAAG